MVNNNEKDNIINDLKRELISLDKEQKAILDISVYPELYKILTTDRIVDFSPTYYFPDTIKKLLIRAKEDERYYYFVTKLFMRWTKRFIDIKLLNKIFLEGEYPHVKINLITKEVVDERIYSFCYKNFVAKDLVIELSPEFNLIGDLIGKMLGFAKKSKTPILMMNKRLVTEIKRLIPIFETANMFVDQKQQFFSRFLPLKRTRGIRWFIGITVGTVVSPVGFVLAVVDP